MIRITKRYDVSAMEARMSRKEVLAKLRHEHTNYDDLMHYLTSDVAEQLIMETAKVMFTMVGTDSAYKALIAEWASKKLKTLR